MRCALTLADGKAAGHCTRFPVALCSEVPVVWSDVLLQQPWAPQRPPGSTLHGGKAGPATGFGGSKVHNCVRPGVCPSPSWLGSSWLLGRSAAVCCLGRRHPDTREGSCSKYRYAQRIPMSQSPLNWSCLSKLLTGTVEASRRPEVAPSTIQALSSLCRIVS